MALALGVRRSKEEAALARGSAVGGCKRSRHREGPHEAAAAGPDRSVSQWCTASSPSLSDKK